LTGQRQKLARALRAIVLGQGANQVTVTLTDKAALSLADDLERAVGLTGAAADYGGAVKGQVVKTSGGAA
jgi:hypothetical protein